MNPDLKVAQTEAGDNGDGPGGGDITQYRVVQLEKKVENLSGKMDEMNTSVIQIKSGMVTKLHLFYTAVCLLGTVIVHVILKNVSF